jgi:hypothetical protein
MSERVTTFPAYPSVCTICGALFDPRAGDHLHGPVALIAGKDTEWTGRRPTYDELALAVLAFQRAYGRDPWHDPWKPGHWDDWEKVGETLCDLARRLEPGP